MTINQAAADFTALGIYTVGVPVVFTRLSGFSPRVVSFEASVTALVRLVQTDNEPESRTGYTASKPGAITQDDREIIVMASDLASARFPLPIVKGDRVRIDGGTEEWNVAKVDAYKRAMSGAIEITVSGVH